ncbi:hypothetical protein ACE7GA_25445 [Roseomonas sp. CCTCC AB2023176]|uniref:hypothetical protein n=1 Tax=Roseomonas sp. CCTCC AB2023176 TaxID=3342640 RepID=UPI0035D6850E
MAATWVTAGGKVSLYGLSGTGDLWDRSPDSPRTPGPKRWPETMTIPVSLGGSGRAIKVREVFEAAFVAMARMANPKTNAGCDTYFKALGPREYALSQLLTWKFLIYRYGSADIETDLRTMSAAATYTKGTETLSAHPGTSMVQIMIDPLELTSASRLAATLVHELAHVAGAPGRPSDADWNIMPAKERKGYYAAESALKKCGFSEQHDPDIYGVINGRTGIAQGSRLA